MAGLRINLWGANGVQVHTSFWPLAITESQLRRLQKTLEAGVAICKWQRAKLAKQGKEGK